MKIPKSFKLFIMKVLLIILCLMQVVRGSVDAVKYLKQSKIGELAAETLFLVLWLSSLVWLINL